MFNTWNIIREGIVLEYFILLVNPEKTIFVQFSTFSETKLNDLVYK